MKLLLLSLIFVYLNAESVSSILSKIELLNKIASKSFKEVKVDYDPFVNAKKILSKKSEKKNSLTQKAIVTNKSKKNELTLITILNNKAFINSKWYTKGGSIFGYKIVAIDKDAVLLKQKQKIKYLKIKRAKKLFKVEEKKEIL